MSAPLAAVVLLAGGLTAWSLGPASAAPGSFASVDVADDFNGDGYADLVIGAPDATVSAKAKAGYVAVMYGSKSGLSTTKRKLVSRSTSGVPGSATANQRFPSSVMRDCPGVRSMVACVAGGITSAILSDKVGTQLREAAGPPNGSGWADGRDSADADSGGFDGD
ncbi:integrin alpha [Streptomyces tailanensis]|uniref:integrin alpha n=1 Tax=Streptomyces tailanensis TaxID=2569858 RepID=UPI003CCC85D8